MSKSRANCTTHLEYDTLLRSAPVAIGSARQLGERRLPGISELNTDLLLHIRRDEQIKY